MKKTSYMVIALLIIFGGISYAQEEASCVETILENFSNRNFAAKAIAQEDIDTIIACGVKSPSARNSQPWHFTVVSDQKVAKKIIPDMKKGNILIVISGKKPAGNLTVAMDCALATQTMYLAAQSMGLLSRIYTGPIAKAKALTAELELPKNFVPVMMLRVGHHINKVDGMSSASSRKEKKAIVNYIK